MDILIFGDQTVDPQQFLVDALLRKEKPLLAGFLERTHVALRAEIGRLPRYRRDQLPDFSSVHELARRYYGSKTRDPALDSTLLSVAQFSHWIALHEDRPLEYPVPKDTQILGVCTGLLAASAVASCPSLAPLIPLAVETVAIAFRAGELVATVSDRLEQRLENDTWSTIIGGQHMFSIESEIEEFNKEQALSSASQLYLSASSSSSVTISGPPAHRKLFFRDSPLFQKSNSLNIPVRGPYHAPHLFDESDLDGILTPETSSFLKQHSVAFVLASAVTGDQIVATTALDLFKQALLEILVEPIFWDKVIERCLARVNESHHDSVRVLAVGPTTMGNKVVSALKTAGTHSISLEDTASWLNDNRLPRHPGGHLADSKIAIIGMAGRFPNAADHEEFWSLLERGLDVHREVPPDRFSAKDHCDPSGKGRNKTHTPYGCFIDNPGLFDPRFFNMSPREATQTDPMQRLSITTAYEAMEMAGFVPNRTPSTKLDRIGTFYGQTSDDWREINAAQDIDTYFITGGVRAFGPGRINYHWNFSGPSFNIDTACSSSLAAINLACTSLRAGDCDTVFAGGMNIMTNPDIFSGLSKGQFLSKTGSCKTYDNDADGYCRGDGVATVILKRYDDAIADGDPILGVIGAIGTNHSAEAISITHPHEGAQKFLFQQVMDRAGVDVNQVGYVEMHGTGTQAGDKIEMASVSSVFAPLHKKRRSDQALFLGSTKANIGHGEAVSGVTALIKVLLMLEKEIIPPHVGIKNKINQGFPKDFKERNVKIASQREPFPRHADSTRYVFLNNFSAAGGNTAMLIEDAPKRPQLNQDPRTMNVVCVSAKSLGSFRKNLERLISYIDNTSPHFGSLAYTTSARRSHYNYRLAIPAENLVQLQERLGNLRGTSRVPIPGLSPKVAFAFTGQGSHYLGLGKKLFEDSKKFRSEILAFDRTARRHGFESFIPLINGEYEDASTLSPVVVQLGITCVQMALALLWKSWGVLPSVVIGHSLGEYAALQVAGVLSISDTIYLVGTRAKLLVERCKVSTHGMLAMRGDFSKVTEIILNIPAEVACKNGPQDTVLSGTETMLKNSARAFGAQGFKCTYLNVPFAFHSAQVDPILDEFEARARSAIFHKPTVPVLSPLLRSIVRDGQEFSPNYLRRHCRECVDFSGAFNEAMLDGIIDEKTLWFEVGPHPVCSAMIKSLLPTANTAYTLRRDEDPWKTSAYTLSALYNEGVPIDWNEFHQDFNGTYEVLRLPSYAFDEKVYWIQYGPNNWCLTKGDATVGAGQTDTPVPKLSTTSVQTIVEEDVEDNIAFVVGQSDLAEPLLRSAISGHLVNGAGLCPSSLYADMAMTLCDYAYRLIRPETKSEDIHMNVRSMETHKPLVIDLKAPKSESRLLQMETRINLNHNRAEVIFRGVYADGKPAAEYAKCRVDFEEASEWIDTWSRNKFLVKSRVDILKTKMKTGKAHRILRGMAYKLFAALVNYDQKYRGMEEVILDSEELEATSKVVFQATEEDGNFFMSPYFIDSVAHIAGFVMNANDAVDSGNSVYISHGWENMRFSEKLQVGQTYTSWVKMQPVAGQGKMVIGDVYVFKDGNPIGVVGGLKFQCVPRNLLDTLLKPARPATRRMSNMSLAITDSAPQPAAGKQKVAKVGQKPSPLKVKAPGSYSDGLPLKSPAEIARDKGITRQALEILASEIGCDMMELQDNVEFSQMGCDSLMSLTIAGRLREDLNLNVPSTLFIDCPTVSEMKGYLSQFEDADPAFSSSSSSENASATESPLSLSPSLMGEDDLISYSGDSDDECTKRIIRTTIASEMGMDLEEISGNTDLSQIGMDSLMSLSILGALRENTGLNLHSDFLLENSSIHDIEKTLFGNSHKPSILLQISSMENIKAQKPFLHGKASLPTPPRSPPKKLAIPASPGILRRSTSLLYPPANSILLQGNAKTATRKLFLLPDGSGTASAYAPISDVDSEDICVYGMNCPFMKDPDSFTIGLPEVIRIYKTEMKRRQPEGPYLLGGWSAGGVLAYELTRQLISDGDEVERLVLIDAPCPIRLEALPSTFHRFCNKIGLLGDGKTKIPDWLLPHFRSTVRELTNYSELLDDWLDMGIVGENSDIMDKMPLTTVIWARDGVCKYPDDPRPEVAGQMPNSMQWLVENRTDFGANGWEKLLPVEKIRCAEVDGNHFTMMRDPIVKELGPIIKQALET